MESVKKLTAIPRLPVSINRAVLIRLCFALPLLLSIIDYITADIVAFPYLYMFGMLALYRLQANSLYMTYAVFATILIAFTALIGPAPAHWGNAALGIALLFGFSSTVVDQVRTNERLLTLAMTDPLTGILNRRHFLSASTAELSRVKRYGFPLTLLMIDIDNFKSVNDTYGHGVGDIVIRTIANTCRTALRLPDILARYGGEEFVVTMPQTAEPEAKRVAERLRESLSEAEIDTKDGKLRVTVSIGLAQWITSDNSIEDTIERADQALYAAKRAGKNCVTVAPRSALTTKAADKA
jgi:diguanylate cyclase (GGDEF)-like protein